MQPHFRRSLSPLAAWLGSNVEEKRQEFATFDFLNFDSSDWYVPK